MYPSIRERLQDGVKQEILTNYYLNKYDKYMNKITPQTYSSILNKSKSRSRQDRSQRKNFKHILLTKKYGRVERSIEEPCSNSLKKNAKDKKKNFKAKLQDKKNQKKQMKENMNTFLRLESSIINELYSPSPTKLESGKYDSIQIRHKFQYEQKKSHPLLLIPADEEDPIEIQQFVDERQEHLFPQHKNLRIQVNSHEEQLSRISQAIKSKFERRKPRKAKGSTPSKSSRKSSPINYKSVKYPPKRLNSISQQKIQKQEKNKSQVAEEDHNEFLVEENEENQQNVRSFFQAIEEKTRRRLTIEEREHSVRQGSVQGRDQKRSKSRISLNRSRTNSKAALNNSRFYSKKDSDRRSQYSSYSRRSERFHGSHRGSYRGQNQGSHHESNHSQQDSLDEIFPQLPQESKQYEYVYDSQSFENREDHQSLGDMPTSELRESTHELSVISRFSMTNDEGIQIREHLEKEINENQFGPYQNALANLMDLIDEYPNAWPIFVVGQRILQDRKQYDEKRLNQNEQILKLQNKILRQKKQITRRQKTLDEKGRNNLMIMRLVRRLGEIVY